MFFRRLGTYAGIACVAGAASFGVTACSGNIDDIKPSQERFEKCMEDASGTSGFERQSLVEFCHGLLRVR